MRFGLTAKEKIVYDLLREHIRKHGIAPTFEEMAELTGMKSKSGAFRCFNGLERKGWIMREPGRARSIKIIKGFDDEIDMRRLIASRIEDGYDLPQSYAATPQDIYLETENRRLK